MTYTITHAVIFVVLTLIQMTLPIGQDRTYFSYYIPYLLIVTRLLFLGRTLGIPIPKAIAPVSELAVLSLSLFFFAMAVYKHSFYVNTIGIITVIGITLLIIALQTIHDVMHVYVLVDEDDEEN
jgi:hypothetical protein